MTQNHPSYVVIDRLLKLLDKFRNPGISTFRILNHIQQFAIGHGRSDETH